MRVEVRLDDTLRVVNTNRAFIKFLGAGSQESPSLKPFLAEPEVSAELLRGCMDGMGSDELGASSARVINVVFNTRSLGSQDGGATAGSTPRQAVCRATPCQSDSRGATLKLEVLEVIDSGVEPLGRELPGPGPRSLGRSLAARCSM